MKKTILISILICSSFFVFGQENEEANLIDLDSTWGKEIFKFPIRFAKNINYKGIEEARFPPKGWREVNHLNFWTYAFAWDINLNREITAKELALDLVKYFDGLNDVREDNNINQKASAVITKTKREGLTTFFKGEIKTYDHFTTNKRFTLHALIESKYCKKKEKTFILFRFSPKGFNHKVWKTTLKEVKIYSNLCD